MPLARRYTWPATTVMFEQRGAFDPTRDSKIPLRRDPVSLLLRGLLAVGTLALSRHPVDAVVWAASLLARRRALAMAVPWLTFDAVRAIRPKLSEGARVFEYGGGHSTIYWLTRGCHVVTVEDDPEWHRRIGEAIARRELTNATLHLASGEDDYVEAIRQCPYGSFDVVLVDGSYRRRCVREAVPYVAPGGLLVVDNTDWHWFRDDPLEGIPGSWSRRRFPGYAPMIGHVTETTVWARPPGEPPRP